MTDDSSEHDKQSGPVRPVMWLLATVLVVACSVITNAVLVQRGVAALRQEAALDVAHDVVDVEAFLGARFATAAAVARDPELVELVAQGAGDAAAARADALGAALLFDAVGQAVSADERVVSGSEMDLAAKAARGGIVNLESGRMAVVVPVAGSPYFVGVPFSDPLAMTLVHAEVHLLLLVDPDGVIRFATADGWAEQTVAAMARGQSVAIGYRLLGPKGDIVVNGRPYLQASSLVGADGWTVVRLVSTRDVRARANGGLAILLLGFGLLATLYGVGQVRWTAQRLAEYVDESAKLRALNQRLQREIAERQRAELSLEVAEQTIAQSSKLAALGEMSAAVSHELNQPLGAMKTYLAGARLLLERDRTKDHY